MGGIAGIVYPDVFQTGNVIEGMLGMIVHRCPLNRHTFSYKNVQIGACGHPITQNPKKTISVCLDGHIFNTEELKHELKQKGHHLTTDSTTETLVHAYEVWGEDFIERLDGDFALALFDQERETLFLARDRIGKKPLYWFHDQHHFLFASELKALLATGIVPPTPAVDALATYLAIGYIPQDMSPVQEVNKLLPGHFLKYTINHSKSIHPYWSYSSFFKNTLTDRTITIANHLNRMLQEAIKHRLPKEEVIGCLVSGGLGSASVAHYLHHACPSDTKLSAFTVGFQGQNDEDVEAASVVANALKIPHQTEAITPQTFLDNLVRVAWHLDEPLADPNTLATWKLAQLAAQKTRTVFSGMGSDELLSGHSRYTKTERKLSFLDWLKGLSQPIARSFLVPFLYFFYKNGAYHLLKQSRTNPWQAEYLKHNALFDSKTLALASPSLARLFDPDTFLHRFHHLSRITSPVASFLYFDVKTRLADCFVLQYDRLTAAHSLDWHTPYLERKIVEYLAGFPEPESLAEIDTASCLKLILKDAFPEQIINRPKKTRKDFLKPWVEQGNLCEIFQLLAKGSLVEAGLISERWLQSQTETAPRCRSGFQHLWAILALEVWFRLFINRPLTTQPPDISVRDLLTES